MGSGFVGPFKDLLPVIKNNPVSLPLIQLLRSPVDFLIGYHVMFSILIAFGFQFLLERTNSSQRRKQIALVLIVIVFSAMAVPNTMWYNRIETNINDSRNSFRDLYKENPELVDFYHKIASEKGDYRVLILPMLRYLNPLENKFQHARPWSDDPLSLWSPKQKIEVLRVNPSVQEETNYFAKSLSDYNLGEILYYLNLFDVKYIVLRSNVQAPSWVLSSGWSYSNDRYGLQSRILDSHKDLFEHTFSGNVIDVYKFRDFKDRKITAIDESNQIPAVYKVP